MFEPRLCLRPGVRVSERGGDALQVGLHEGRRLVMSDDPSLRALLALLAHGVERRRLDTSQRGMLERMEVAGLLVDPDAALTRSRIRQQAHVELLGAPSSVGALRRLLAESGVRTARAGTVSITVLVTVGAEPRRDTLDALVQGDRPHLLLTSVAGRLRIGPFVVPGLTACLRCLDEHLTDADPRHPLVVEQHLEPDPEDIPETADLQLALAWAARDVVKVLHGERPTTWSATVDLEPEGPVTQRWRRHPRCGCAWGDALTG